MNLQKVCILWVVKKINIWFDISIPKAKRKGK